MRGIFFDEDHARAVVERLLREGFTAELTREKLAGEDDDEDHPWAVVTDAPEPVLDVLVDKYDGWLDAGDDEGARDRLEARPSTSPLPLPTEPRRLKRPQ